MKAATAFPWPWGLTTYTAAGTSATAAAVKSCEIQEWL
jgi:hypothetical protein